MVGYWLQCLQLSRLVRPWQGLPRPRQQGPPRPCQALRTAAPVLTGDKPYLDRADCRHYPFSEVLYVRHKDDAAPSSPMRSSTDSLTIFQAVDRAPIVASSGSWFTGSSADGEDGGGAGWRGGRGGSYIESPTWQGGVAGDVYGRFVWRVRGLAEEWEWDGIGEGRPNQDTQDQANLGQHTNEMQLNVCANSASSSGFFFSGIVKGSKCEEGFKTCTNLCGDTSSAQYRHAASGDGGGRGGGDSSASCDPQDLLPEVRLSDVVSHAEVRGRARNKVWSLIGCAV